MYDRILVPTDGSRTVDLTLEHAFPIARDNDATVYALYVVDARMVRAATGETRAGIESELETEGERAVEAVTDRATEAGLDSVGAIEHGTPAKEIVDYADREATDLIAIGTHGKSPREKQLTLGSVSERVVDGASTPVLVVRNADPPEHSRAETDP